MSAMRLRAMERGDWPAVAELVHAGTNAWYEARGMGSIFRGPTSEVQELHCRVYEELDPGCCVVADDGERLLGSCFYHPRSTHVSLGIMNAHPDAFGRGVARRLLRYVVDLAREQKKPVRLVSSALNLDSFSLYNRAGFRPFAVYQDMLIEVPEEGLGARPAGIERVRASVESDAPRMAALEQELVGIEREADYRYFHENAQRVWRTCVSERLDGVLDGFLVSVAHPACTMLGPGVARDEATALALIVAQLDQLRGSKPVWLVPCDRPALTSALYALGARNCELHLAQVLGEAAPPSGVVMPTFLPETG